MRLATATWRDAEEGGALLVPLGATEQHGPHLPLGTDTTIVEAIVNRFERARPEVWIAPTLDVGASGEHAGFPGTLSLGTAALTEALVELGRSADHFDSVFFANWHGGNLSAVRKAVDVLRYEGRRAGAWLADPPRYPDGRRPDLHAGRLETSLMLAIEPDVVRGGSLGMTSPDLTPDLPAALRSSGVKAVSPSGILGDPEGAGEKEGWELLEALASQLLDAYEAFVGGEG